MTEILKENNEYCIFGTVSCKNSVKISSLLQIIGLCGSSGLIIALTKIKGNVYLLHLLELFCEQEMKISHDFNEKRHFFKSGPKCFGPFLHEGRLDRFCMRRLGTFNGSWTNIGTWRKRYGIFFRLFF